VGPTTASQPPSPDVRRLIDAARGGSAPALGELLEACRPYLLVIANQQLQPGVQGKVGASDVVQETFLNAHAHFEQFHGQTEQELLAWLRRILLNNLTNTARHFQGTDRRQTDREVSLDAEDAPEKGMMDPGPSPSSAAVADERDEALHRALERLSEQYRQVIQLRNWELRSFEEIGQLTNRTPEASRKLWVRAIEQLRSLLEPPHESHG
jgi:RNA polymerase sigma-70 factor (ECF subfamily)